MKSIFTTLSELKKKCTSVAEADRNLRYLYLAVISVASCYSFWADVRPFAARSRFIGHADQAEVASVARNLAEGNGPLTDCVWLLHAGGRPTDKVRQPIGYWSLYVAYFLSVPFKIFGASRITMLGAASVTKISCSLLGAALVTRFTKNRIAGAACLVTLLFFPYMRDRVNGYSDIWVATAILACIASLTWAVNRQHKAGWIIAGALGGLAIGFKPTGVLVLGLYFWLLVLPWTEPVNWRRRIAFAIYLSLGCAITLSPLMLHNYKSSGSIMLPDSKLVKSAALSRQILQEVNHDTAFFDPGCPIVAKTWNSQFRGFVTNLKQFTDGFLSPKRIALLIITIPVIAVLYYRSDLHLLHGFHLSTDPRCIFAFLTALLFIAGFLLIAVVHYESRYWAFLIPPSVVIGFTLVTQNFKVVIPFVFIGLALFAIVSGLKPNPCTMISKKTCELNAYRAAASLLPPDSIVLTTAPWEFSFHTRLRSVVLPPTDNVQTICSVANRYGAQYVVLVCGKHRHESFQTLVVGNFPTYLNPVLHTDSLVIGEFTTPTP